MIENEWLSGEISNIFLRSRKWSGSFTPVKMVVLKMYISNKQRHLLRLDGICDFNGLVTFLKRWLETMFLKGERGSIDLLITF